MARPEVVASGVLFTYSNDGWGRVPLFRYLTVDICMGRSGGSRVFVCAYVMGCVGGWMGE